MSDNQNKMEPIDGIPQLLKEDVEKLAQNLPQGVKLIDIREEDEYEAGHIPGVPLIPMSQIADRFHEFEPDMEYVFICRSGKRSQRVSEFFREQGFTKVNNFYGGMLTWDRSLETGLPEKSSGE
jgi:rhodanese-related sulfurtransferase